MSLARRSILAVLLASPAIAQPGLAQPVIAQPANVAVTEVWARATPGPAGTGAVYATVTASQPDRLTGATTPVAAMAELHQSSVANDMAQMRPVAGGLPVTPGTPVRLSPGGYHIMLMQLKHPLQQGEHFPITFTFQHAAPVTTEVTVTSPGGTAPNMASGPGMK